MKKFIKIVLPIIIVFGIFYLGYSIIQISQNKKTRDERIVHIPAFELKNMKGDIVSNTDLKQHVPVLFLYFNSECDFCQAETEEIVANINKLEGIQIVFVSNEPIPQITAFQQKYKLDEYGNVKILCDYNYKFAELLGLKTIPSSFIYSKEGVLLSKNNGPMKVDYLLKSMKQMVNN